MPPLPRGTDRKRAITSVLSDARSDNWFLGQLDDQPDSVVHPAYERPGQQEVSGSTTPAQALESAESARHVLLTRAQAARHMGVSIATVRRMEGAELQPIMIDGKHCFPIEAVDRHRKITDGDLAAQAFAMFNDDKTPVEVVIALKEAPDRIRKLFQDWVELSECLVAGPPGLDHRRLMRFLGRRLTRRCLLRCVQLVFADPRLRAVAERELTPAPEAR